MNDRGEKVSGDITADSLEAAQSTLANQGNIPLEVKPRRGKTAGGGLPSLFQAKVKTPEIILFTKQFRTMLQAGIPILQIFTIMVEQSKNPGLKKALELMGQGIKEGDTLYAVFHKQPRIFSKLYCGLINAGEISGTMPQVLDRITYIMDHEYKVKRDIKSALAYPKMVVITLCGAFFFLLTFVIPKFITVFNKAKLTLPLPTRICLWMYHGIEHYWPFMLIITAGVIIGVKAYCKTDRGAIARDLLFVRLPIVGPLFIKSAMSRFASILAILLGSGITALNAFEILADTIGNAAIAKEFRGMSDKMAEGRGISEPLKNSKFFPPMVVNMVAIGEESGSLEDMLQQLASHYDEEVEFAVAGLSEAIGPILIVALAVVVGFFALAIYLPMWDLTKLVH
ncbi:MAG: type II secretion system F family protein [Deltaproteobacteria bacterium]|nr:type II secretion system F family protein [Deltaproteobacteria bacterium]